MLYQSAIKVIDAKIGLLSNNEDLVKADEFLSEQTQYAKPTIWSILTALPAPQNIPFVPKELDEFFYVLDHPGVEPDVIISDDKCIIIGDFSKLEKSVKDIRWNIYGNVGIFFCYVLRILEKHYGIHSLHASALYNPKENLLLSVIGSSGSGKTVLQLEALLNHDYQIFSTEMTHFKVAEDGVTFYKGSVFDNIRVGNLVYDFPEAVKRFKINVPEVSNKWDTYLPVDFTKWSTKEKVLKNPRVVLLYPKIESSRSELILSANPSKETVIRATYENASEKISKSQVLYGGFPAFSSFDSQVLARKRLADVHTLLDSNVVKGKVKMLAGPKDCWAWEKAIK